jgi:hypothetical protein
MQKSTSNCLVRVTRHSYFLQAGFRSAVTSSCTSVIASLFLIDKDRPERSSLSADMSPSLKRRTTQKCPCITRHSLARQSYFVSFGSRFLQFWAKTGYCHAQSPYSWSSRTRGLTQTLLITRDICVRVKNGFNVVSLNRNMQEHVPSQYDLKYYRNELSSHTVWSGLVRTVQK